MRVIIDYTNWRGERRERLVEPLLAEPMVWGKSEWHPEDQWLLQAMDMKDGVVKQWAMSGIHSWRKVS